MLDCDPHLNDIEELINELNRTNGLFKFVRIMRARFQEAAALGMVSFYSFQPACLVLKFGTPQFQGHGPCLLRPFLFLQIILEQKSKFFICGSFNLSSDYCA